MIVFELVGVYLKKMQMYNLNMDEEGRNNVPLEPKNILREQIKLNMPVPST